MSNKTIDHLLATSKLYKDTENQPCVDYRIGYINEAGEYDYQQIYANDRLLRKLKEEYQVLNRKIISITRLGA